MLRRVATICVVAVLLTVGAISAAGARTPGLYLASSTLQIDPPSAPTSPDDLCDTYSAEICGAVSVAANFAGLDAFPRPTGGGDPFGDGNLTGTVHVTRKYGCQDANGKRLHGYNRTVVTDDYLDTRWGFGFDVPPTGDVLSVLTFVYLPDAQPGNCPAGTQPMTYEIKARGVRLVLQFYGSEIPGGNYRASGRADWRGAVAPPITLRSATAATT